MKYFIFISAIVGPALIYLLSSSSANSEVFSISYYALLVFTGLFALGLAGLVGVQLTRLRNRIRNKVFGAKLTLRLVVFFTLIAVLPGLLLYVVSANFLSKSIESWFDVRVEKALEGGLNLGRSGLDNSLKELTKKTQFIALLLSDKHPKEYQRSLEQVLDKKVEQEAALFTPRGNVVAFSSSSNTIMPEIPDGSLLQFTLDTGEYAVIDALPRKGLTLRSLVRVNANTRAGGQICAAIYPAGVEAGRGGCRDGPGGVSRLPEADALKAWLETPVCDHPDAFAIGGVADGGVHGVLHQRATGLLAGSACRRHASRGAGRFHRPVSGAKQR